jgi:hypothetical protein
VECPLTVEADFLSDEFHNAANIQIISGLTKHHSKQLWITEQFEMI